MAGNLFRKRRPEIVVVVDDQDVACMSHGRVFPASGPADRASVPGRFAVETKARCAKKRSGRKHSPDHTERLGVDTRSSSSGRAGSGLGMRMSGCGPCGFRIMCAIVPIGGFSVDAMADRPSVTEAAGETRAQVRGRHPLRPQASAIAVPPPTRLDPRRHGPSFPRGTMIRIYLRVLAALGAETPPGRRPWCWPTVCWRARSFSSLFCSAGSSIA